MNPEVSLDKRAHSNSIKNEANLNFAIILIRKEKHHYMHGLLFPQSRPVSHMFTSLPLIIAHSFCPAPDNDVHHTVVMIAITDES